MHEITVSESLLERIDLERQRRPFTRVRRVRLEVSSLSSVDPEDLRHAIELLSRGTFLEDAKLQIDQPYGRGVCPDCGAEVVLEARPDGCPVCGSAQFQLPPGKQLNFIEIEVA